MVQQAGDDPLFAAIIREQFPNIDPRRLPGFTRVTAETLISVVPLLFFGGFVDDPTAGHGVAIFDGQNATSGHAFGSILVAANVTNSLLLPHPVIFQSGLFVTVVTSFTEATLLWRPLLADELAAVA